MPDIIDVVLAKALTPQGQIQSAARQAREAVADANDAVETIESLTSEAERIQQLSRTTLTEITSISEYAEEIKDGLAVVDEAILGELNDEINKLAFELNAVNGANARVNNIKISYPDGEKVETLQGVVKYYTTIGQNQDGTMTQKAITNALAQSGTGGNANLGPENAGKMVKVGNDGYLTPSEITQEALLNGNIHIEPENPDSPVNPDEPSTDNTGILGLNITYPTGTIEGINDISGSTSDIFNQYAMYSGRKRCLVDNDGTIVAFYGDNNYTDTPNNGYQVMVYQPKFYYKRTPLQTKTVNNCQVIVQQTIQISDTPKSGYKLHPLFINDNNEELNYVLLSAYQGSIETTDGNSYKERVYDNFNQTKLSSVSDAKPISGKNNQLTLMNAETLANNRGNGWHIMNIQALSAQQMLQLIEFGNLNGQSTFAKGIDSITNNGSNNQSATTGATKTLGNRSGIASSTSYIYNNNSYTETAEGKLSFAYRGMQNPWGNIWQLINGILVTTSSNDNSIHNVNICINYNYDSQLTADYLQTNLHVDHSCGWISGFGYDSNYDWLFIPIEHNSNANSIGPVGDYVWAPYTGGPALLLAGGVWNNGTYNGPFALAWDRPASNDYSHRVGARLIYIPHLSNSNYQTNITKWTTSMEG